ncbi:MAG TPA: hypothetical protein VJO34_00320, partial [Methylomirabilota bacterium]|nr:hypothetical protein [Methylomirabilota bacterium]
MGLHTLGVWHNRPTSRLLKKAHLRRWLSSEGGHTPLPNLPLKLAPAKPALERRALSLVVATYISVRLTPRFLLPAGRHGAALHLDLF